jgi:hypothetical protein
MKMFSSPELWNLINRRREAMKDSAYFCCWVHPFSLPGLRPSTHCGIHKPKWVVEFFNQNQLISYKNSQTER